MSETDNIMEKDTGLMLDFWESQKPNGDIDLEAQKMKAIETTRFYSDLYTNAVNAREQERTNAENAFNDYIGINGRQWDSHALKILTEQKRPANTFNLIKSSVDKVYGQLVMNPNTINFTPINQSETSEVNIVQSLYEYDFERGNWQKEKNKFTKDLIIHTGILEIYKDYRHNNVLGNISIRSLNRFTDIEFEPFWNTDDMNDCQIIFKPTWKTARQLKDEYKTKSIEIDEAIKSFERRDGYSPYTETKEELAQRTTEYYDTEKDRYRVIEVVYMQKVMKTKRYSQDMQRFLQDNENPDTMRGSNDTIIDYQECENACKVIIMVPGVQHGLILQEGKHPIQIGRLPFFVASADMTMGVRQGSVAIVSDAQRVLNKRQSMITGNQITSTNGGLIVKENFFKDNAEYNNFVLNRNVPGKVFKADDNAKLSDGIMAVPTGQEPRDLFESVKWAEQFIEKSLNITDSISGRSGGANESGTLFESKKSQSQIAHVNISETIAQIDKELAEGYFYACKSIYKGPRRTLTNAKSGKQIEINKRVMVESQEIGESEEGGPIVNYLSNFETINEIATLPRHDVVIKRSELGLDQKQRSLSIFSEMMQRSNNPIFKSIYEMAMVPLLEIPEELIPSMNQAGQMFVELQIAQTKNNIKLLNDAMIQSDINTKMLQAQSGQQQQQQGQPAPDARQVANGAGMGNLPEGIAKDSSGANNQSASDV